MKKHSRSRSRFDAPDHQPARRVVSKAELTQALLNDQQPFTSKEQELSEVRAELELSRLRVARLENELGLRPPLTERASRLAADAAATAKQQMQQSANYVGEKASAVGSAVNDAITSSKELAESAIAATRHGVERSLSEAGDAAAAAASKAKYVSETAVEKTDDLALQIEQFARRNPVVALGAAMAFGVLLSSFMRGRDRHD